MLKAPHISNVDMRQEIANAYTINKLNDASQACRYSVCGGMSAAKWNYVLVSASDDIENGWQLFFEEKMNETDVDWVTFTVDGNNI